MSTDILFIHPGNHKKNYQDLANEYTAIATPSWTSLLAGSLRSQGIATAVYDVNVDGWDDETAGQVVSASKPRAVVIMVYGHNPSASTQTMPAAGAIARSLKKYNKDIPILMGGTHPSALPQRTLREEAVDYVIQGEAAISLREFAGFLDNKRDLKDVPGLWYKLGAEPVFSGPAPIVEDLDAVLGDYAWDLLPPLDKYRAHTMNCFQDFEKSLQDDFVDVRSPYVAMNTSLGCPYNCDYCCINALFGKPRIRYWSLEKVLSWLDELVKRYRVRNIRFDDELFILSQQRIERFCEMIIERGYDLNLWVYGRVDTVKPALLAKMKRAGINWICLGIESANEKVRSNVNKNIRGDVRDTVKAIQAHEIYVLGNYMFGLPQDSQATMEETMRQAMELNCEFVNFYSVMAYPGSRLYGRAEKQGLVPKNWECFSQHSYETQPLPTDHVAAADVLKFRDEAFYRYFSSPGYLAMMSRRFGSKVRRHLEKMIEIKIKRKLLEA
jgi:anaerobic magnesium-protoporphyrin IX monomethyl ester cyclase